MALLKRQPSIASVTALIARCVALRSSASRAGSGGSITGSASNSAQTRCTSRHAPSTPAAVHCTSRSGGESLSTHSRAASTP